MAKGRKGGRVEPRLTKERPSLRVGPADRTAAPARAKSAGKARARGGSARKKARAPRLSPTWLLRRGLYWGTVAALWGVILAAGLVLWYGLQLPSTAEWQVPQRPPNVRIVSTAGELIGNRGETGGEAARLGSLPAHVADAVIAIEDHRFRSHFGIDPIGLARAAARNLVAGRVAEGGSTLTQQLAKNMFLTPERSLRRKVQEVVLALWLETKFTKDEILEMYLNRVYFGAGAYGVDAAARRYFDKPASRLTLAEAATLAGVLRAPSHYSPSRNPERARERAGLVIEAMRREGFVSAKAAAAALKAPAQVAARDSTGSENYVADWVTDQLPGLVGEINQDIVVETSIDLGLQRDAEAALVDGLRERGEEFGVAQGALVAIDGTGAVRAMVGGRSYARSQFNRAVQAKRQPGSAFKPFVYLAALERGLTPETVRIDERVRIGNWTPENATRQYRGPVTLKNALALSLNTVAATLAVEVGPKAVVKVARRLGISSELQPNASLALGTSEVTPLELMGAYAVFANGGFAVEPHAVTRIRTASGRLLYERPAARPPRVVAPEHVRMMNDMLAATLVVGTGREAGVPGWPAAGKTGTSQAFRDAWFVGYTSNLTAGVWLGNDSGEPTKRASGANLPAAVWSDFMARAHRGVPVAGLPGAEAFPGESGPAAVPASVRREAAPQARVPRDRTILDLIFGE